VLIPCEQDPPSSADVPAWRDVHRFWLELMRVYSRDCARAGVDNLDPTDLRYSAPVTSPVSCMRWSLLAPPPSASAFIAEAQQFLAEQDQRARLEPPAPMRWSAARARGRRGRNGETMCDDHDHPPQPLDPTDEQIATLIAIARETAATAVFEILGRCLAGDIDRRFATKDYARSRTLLTRVEPRSAERSTDGRRTKANCCRRGAARPVRAAAQTGRADRRTRAQEHRAENGSITFGVAAGNLVSQFITKAMSSAVDEIKRVVDEKCKNSMMFCGLTGFDRRTVPARCVCRLSGGLGADAISGLEASAPKMNDINRGETDLSKFLDANNLKYKERNGLVSDANKGLELAATLMGKADPNSKRSGSPRNSA
jgi:hypothetical protein